MDTNVLREIGLTDGEIKVYLGLIKIGLSTHGPITKASGVSASKVYKILDRLIEKGLVNYVLKGNTKYFSAGEPEKVKEYYARKEKELKEKERDVNELVKDLGEMQRFSKKDCSAVVYEGFEGLRAVFDNILKTASPKDEFLAFGIPKAPETIQSYFIRFYSQLDKLKVESRIIYNEDAKETAKERHKGQKNIKFRFLSGPTPSTTTIFRDKTILTVRTTEQPLNILIENKQITESNKTYFEYLWKTAK